MKSHLTRVLDFVRDDDAGLAPGLLGVWGMGGVGKTTLLKLVQRSEEYTIRLGRLDDDDAWTLFKDKVGSATINADNRIPELAKQFLE
ncbi:hypothetical protein E2562_016091 [Oryza meyeriana var. granulata]|uniref:NB-ARC domain-containing protein n=1 Tax=Oryza meyeriana var. granulata TaxID=110450 RepID=A0A6G1BJV6_9ORYZ|nr:hypothetical protein E2562_016091 [Oryza meyeriana var. granulata]